MIKFKHQFSKAGFNRFKAVSLLNLTPLQKGDNLLLSALNLKLYKSNTNCKCLETKKEILSRNLINLFYTTLSITNILIAWHLLQL